jgi:hypothetical protein
MGERMKQKLVVSLLVLCLVLFVGSANAKKCEPITFSNVSNNTFECMKSKLQNYGIYVPPGNEGEVSEKGITANFMWDGKSNLTVGVTEIPLFVKCETASNELNNFVEECQGP